MERTLVALGPLTNLAKLLEVHADAAKAVRRIVVLELNLAHDLEAARKVFEAGAPLLVVSEEACRCHTLDEAGVKRVFSPGTPLNRQVQSMFQMWDRESPTGGALWRAAECEPGESGALKGCMIT